MKGIAISAGHYPEAPGAVADWTTEYEENVLWQNSLLTALWAELDKLDVPVHSVPTGKLPAKVKYINDLHSKSKLALAIEIHFNADASGKGRGCETLYHPTSEAGRRWANDIQRSMVPFCYPNRGIKEGWYRMDKPGHVDYKGDVEGDEVVDYFLRATHCPAIIVEPHFLHEKDRIIANRVVVPQVWAYIIKERFIDGDV